MTAVVQGADVAVCDVPTVVAKVRNGIGGKRDEG